MPSNGRRVARLASDPSGGGDGILFDPRQAKHGPGCANGAEPVGTIELAAWGPLDISRPGTADAA
jgi:hypothetical protein